MQSYNTPTAPKSQQKATTTWEESKALARAQPSKVPEEAAKFVEGIGGPRHNFVAISPNPSKPVVGKTDASQNGIAGLEWASDLNQAGCNVYLSLGVPREDSPNKKLSAADIDGHRGVGADIDMPAVSGWENMSVDELESYAQGEEQRLLADIESKLPAQLWPPSITTRTGGGGIQCIWLFPQVEMDTATVRQITVALKRLLGGDAIQNSDRIYRIPGFTNYPDEGKRKKGRVARPARLEQVNDRRFSLSEFACLSDLSRKAPDLLPRDEIDARLREVEPEIEASDFESMESLDDLASGLRSKIRRLIEQNSTFAKEVEGVLRG